METVAFVTVIALLMGPIGAVLIARYIEDRRTKRQQRMEIFRTLMRTRRIPISPEHVGALNLVEIEFKDELEVLSAWKDLFVHFGTAHAEKDDEKFTADMDDKEKATRQQKYHERLHQERQKLLTLLLHAIAKVLKFKIEQLEIFEGGYVPQGWEDIELQQNAIRRFAVDLYLGRRVLPIGVLDYTQVKHKPKEGPGDEELSSLPENSQN